MADVTDVSLWPSCIHAVDWSQDGIIALASDEQVELLFPNTESRDPEGDISQWPRATLKVPWFTKEELPIKEPAAPQIVSIGEEISASFPTSIAWSPPGLAKHRRCALAALTANTVLSIWSSDGRPHEESSWDRRLIVNDSLESFFSTDPSIEKSHVTSDKNEQLRLRKRIRAFAWAPLMHSSQSPGLVGTQLVWEPHMIAVANDDNHIILMAIASPTSMIDTEECWSAEVLQCISITPDPETSFPHPCIFDDIMRQQRHASHLAWSPWAAQGKSFNSILAYATNEDVRMRLTTYSPGTNTICFGGEVCVGCSIRHSGPMRWSPKIESDRALTLALFTDIEVICLSISASDALVLSRQACPLDSRFDQISGVSWDISQSYSPRLQFSSLQSTICSSTNVVEFSSKGLSAMPPPHWREQISDNLALYSVQFELDGNANAKVWGLTTSPLGDFIASCYTMHPTDMIEYGPPSDRRSRIAVNSLRTYYPSNESSPRSQMNFPEWNLSSEGIIWTIRKWFENTVEDADDISAFREQVVQRLMQTCGPKHEPEDEGGTMADHYPSMELGSLVTNLKRYGFFNQYSLRDRYEALVSTVCTPKSDLLLQKALIAFRLATEIQKLPLVLSEASDFSADILSQSEQVIAIIQLVSDPSNQDAEGDLDTEAQPPTSIQAPISATFEETCEFCDARIPFTDLFSARCMNGHPFPRCGLSFLAIQSFGITKYCGICNMPYFSDEFVAAQEEDGVENEPRDTEKGWQGDEPQRREVSMIDADMEITDQPESSTGSKAKEIPNHERVQPERDGSTEEGGDKVLPLSLAGVLFLACDVCIYCGGKFIG